jgi:hypothetical protein
MCNQDNKPSLGTLPKPAELDSKQWALLLEHYKRCEAFWRHWTASIWSVPSVAAAVNIGVYSVIFDSTKHYSHPAKLFCFLLLLFLNAALTVGLWRHKYLQDCFGKRILAIEEYLSIPIVDINQKVRASLVYCMLMVFLCLASLVLLVREGWLMC